MVFFLVVTTMTDLVGASFRGRGDGHCKLHDLVIGALLEYKTAGDSVAISVFTFFGTSDESLDI